MNVEETQPLLNEYAGYLTRIKPNHIDEGGVAAGYGVLGSIVIK